MVETCWLSERERETDRIFNRDLLSLIPIHWDSTVMSMLGWCTLFSDPHKSKI